MSKSTKKVAVYTVSYLGRVVYVGQSVNPTARIGRHKSVARNINNHTHRDYKTPMAIKMREVGVEKFSFNIIGFMDSETASEVESGLIAALKPKFNLQSGGVSGFTYPDTYIPANTIPVIVHGKLYASVTDAYKQTKSLLTYNSFRRRLHNNKIEDGSFAV